MVQSFNQAIRLAYLNPYLSRAKTLYGVASERSQCSTWAI
ncbi:hypothetical protein EBME_0305 [bacterium endosymbiont of Mortierella elongata FMR23-6]|nr:hypothetical protein EBME_0305 [bacterium endosymbiont of Mortierella elongata FMR23-6]